MRWTVLDAQGTTAAPQVVRWPATGIRGSVMRRFVWTSLLAATLVCGSISAGARPVRPVQPGTSPPSASLSKEDRALLARAIAEHRTSVTMVFTAQQGKAADVASRLTAL